MNTRTRRDRVEAKFWSKLFEVSPGPVRVELQRYQRCRERRRQFKRMFGRPVNTEHPTLFTEKIMARILADDTLPLYEVWDDRVTAPLYLGQKTTRPIQFAERLGIWPHVTGENLERLSRPFVVKANLGSAEPALVYEGAETDLAAVASRMNERLRLAVNARGYQYQRFVIAERMLVDAAGGLPVDLNFHCFNRPGGTFDWFLQVETNRFGDHRQDILDSNLNRAPFSFAGMKPSETLPALPTNLDEFVAVARDLSADFDYMRVDLCDLDGRVTFGGLNPCPRSGTGWIEPREWEGKLGALWDWNPEGFFTANI